MIPSFPYLTLILFLFCTPIFTFSNSLQFNPTILTMPGKRNFSAFSQQELRQENINMERSALNRSNKKLRRLPHVFSKVLELPFTSDADVYIDDKQECLKFVVKTKGSVVGCSIHVVEVHPGITKVVVRPKESQPSLIDELELDVWRFRLPITARPELATAIYGRRQLVVIVPKNEWLQKNGH